MIGYGRKPIFADWPGHARVAVQFVLNYEEGGESCVLHGDQASEQFLSEIVGASAFPARHLSIESVYEYGSRAGVWRILREFERRRLVVEHGGFLYDSDYYGDDLPFWTNVKIQNRDRVWICRRIDIARHWHKNHPYQKADRLQEIS